MTKRTEQNWIDFPLFDQLEILVPKLGVVVHIFSGSVWIVSGRLIEFAKVDGSWWAIIQAPVSVAKEGWVPVPPAKIEWHPPGEWHLHMPGNDTPSSIGDINWKVK